MRISPSPFKTTEGSQGHYVGIEDANGKQIARVTWGPGDCGNAMLFAAAPDLLDACRDALQYAAYRRPADDPDAGRATLYLKLQEAIAKAEGRE